jgi:hypothetical protein
VLDPACGTGNFLYVSLEAMKRLEGEVLEALLDLGGQEALRGLGTHSVDPHQFLGLEINPRAAAIAELVLWIGYLQWHFRTKGGPPEEPILRAFRNIQVKNAVLTWDGEPIPKIVDGKETYPNARRPEWPSAEFIVGNPPFTGASLIRARLGDSFTETLWTTHPEINDSADLVMYWWDHAAALLRKKGTLLRRFGLVTTNSISQVLQRRVTERHLAANKPISLVMAIPDHPWTNATDGAAAIRIAMTVAEAGAKSGLLETVIREIGLDTDAPEIEFSVQAGLINSDLTVGTNATNVRSLSANEGLSHKGMQLNGQGFVISEAERNHFRTIYGGTLDQYVRPYMNGRDLVQTNQGRFAIDLYPLALDAVRSNYPAVYQHILLTVKPERDTNRDKSRRERWWWFGRTHETQRDAMRGQSRYIATTRTARHRIFTIVSEEVIAESKIVIIADNDPCRLRNTNRRLARRWERRDLQSYGLFRQICLPRRQ